LEHITIVVTQTSQLKRVLLTEQTLDVDMGILDTHLNASILINHDKIGFFRVCYSTQMFNAILEQISSLNSSCKMGLRIFSFSFELFHFEVNKKSW